MNDKFDLAKAMQNGGKCRTRDCRLARIICTDAAGQEPVVALIAEKNKAESLSRYNLDGSFHTPNCKSTWDLFNLPERIKRDVWVNVYEVDLCVHGSQGEAEAQRGKYCLACVKLTIDCEEGEGLQ